MEEKTTDGDVWPGEDGVKRLSVLVVQGQMLALIDISCKREVIANLNRELRRV